MSITIPKKLLVLPITFLIAAFFVLTMEEPKPDLLLEFGGLIFFAVLSYILCRELNAELLKITTIASTLLFVFSVYYRFAFFVMVKLFPDPIPAYREFGEYLVSYASLNIICTFLIGISLGPIITYLKRKLGGMKNAKKPMDESCPSFSH